MFPIVFGFVAALAFEAVAFAMYGSAALTDYAWVSMVAWGLIGSGVIVYAITQPTPAWLSRLSGRVRGLVNAQFGSTPTLDQYAGSRR